MGSASETRRRSLEKSRNSAEQINGYDSFDEISHESPTTSSPLSSLSPPQSSLLFPDSKTVNRPSKIHTRIIRNHVLPRRRKPQKNILVDKSKALNHGNVSPRVPYVTLEHSCGTRVDSIKGNVNNQLQYHEHPPSPARNKIEPFYFANVVQQHQQELFQPIRIETSQILKGFDFLRPSKKDSLESTIKSEYGEDVRINSRYSLSLCVIEWPNSICECYSDGALCPTEISFSAMIIAKDNLTGKAYKVMPYHDNTCGDQVTDDIWVTTKLLGYNRKSAQICDTSSAQQAPEYYAYQQSQLVIVANDPIGTMKFSMSCETFFWDIIDNHPVYTNQKSLVMINKSSIQKRPYHGAKAKDVVCSDCRSEVIDKETGLVKFSGLNITIPDKLPATSVRYPRNTCRVDWDYSYKLIFYARVKLPFANNKSVLLAALTDRIVTARSRNTIKSRKELSMIDIDSPNSSRTPR